MVAGLRACAQAQDPDWTEMQHLTDRLGELEDAYSRVIAGFETREMLIAGHCRAVAVPVRVHEHYHEVSERLLGDVVAVLGAIKTFANALALFVVASMPHETTRGLRAKGFGALVDSACKPSDDHGSQEVRALLASEGYHFQQAMIEYRNKYIEHPATLVPRNLSHGPDMRVIHTGGARRRRNPSDTPATGMVSHVAMKMGAGEHHFFHLGTTLAKGDHVRPGDPLGVPREPSSHFDRLEPHIHAFGTSQSPPTIGYLTVVEQPEQSPDIIAGMAELLTLASHLIDKIAALRLMAPGDPHRREDRST